MKVIYLKNKVSCDSQPYLLDDSNNIFLYHRYNPQYIANSIGTHLNGFQPIERLSQSDLLSDANLKDLYISRPNEFEQIESQLGIGEYYECVYKPSLPGSVLSNTLNNILINDPDYFNRLTEAKKVLSLYKNKFLEISQYIEPTDSHYPVFSYEMRNLLILLCTEIETEFQVILLKNNYSPTYINKKSIAMKIDKKNWTMDKHYINLLPFLKLDKYQIKYNLYPNLTKVEPFTGWSLSKIPGWYSGYNKTKHNRSLNFSDGNLLNVLNALAGLYIIFAAQYGNHMNDDFFTILPQQYNLFLPEEQYIPIYNEYDISKYTKVNLPLPKVIS